VTLRQRSWRKGRSGWRTGGLISQSPNAAQRVDRGACLDRGGLSCACAVAGRTRGRGDRGGGADGDEEQRAPSARLPTRAVMRDFMGCYLLVSGTLWSGRWPLLRSIRQRTGRRLRREGAVDAVQTGSRSARVRCLSGPSVEPGRRSRRDRLRRSTPASRMAHRS